MSRARVRRCGPADVEAICAVINDAARAYRDVIASDCWKEPYMPREELEEEIENGVAFWGHEEDGRLLGVMGLQRVHDAWLIRHAYVRSDHQGEGIGGSLIRKLREEARPPVLVGTWAAATWAIRFYESRGFVQVSRSEKDELLRRYWRVSERQMEESVVLVQRGSSSDGFRASLEQRGNR
jgi:N-acetylglutamate synthase-like GNAT family acetyltransferase